MIKCKTKKWGNSIGIIIPIEFANEKGIKANEEVMIEIEKKGNVLEELKGALLFHKSTGQLIKESRKELESKFL